MNKKIKLILLFSTLTSFSAISLAQIKVYVNSTAPDSIGSRLSYRIKEGIRRSSGMSLADREEDSVLTVGIVTLDPDRNTQSSSSRTIYSVVWSVKTLHETPVDMYLTNSVGICGSSKVEECAEGLVADTDEQATKVKGWIRSILDNANKK